MVSYSSRITLFVITIGLVILPACSRKLNPRELKSRGKKQIIAGSVLAGMATSAAIAGGSIVAKAGLGPVAIGAELSDALYILLPFAILAAPIAVALIVSGNENRQEGRRAEKRERRKSKKLVPQTDEQPKTCIVNGAS